MTVATTFFSTFALGSVFFQLGGTPIWVPLVIILLIILLFWWGLTRNQITEMDETTADHQEDSRVFPSPGESTDSDELTESDEIIEADDQPVIAVTPDDLQLIEGIGPKISSILAEAGIVTFSQLAETDQQTLVKIVVQDGGIKLAKPGTWPKQAELAAAGQWDALEKLQDELHGGLERK